MTISPFLKNESFNQGDIDIMSKALDDVCNALTLDRDATAREIVAMRIIELTRRGERDPIKLRARLLDEANGASRS